MSFWPQIWEHLAQKAELPGSLVEQAVAEMIRGTAGEAEAAAFLIGLRVKGETAREIAAAAQVLRRNMVAWNPQQWVLDTCGTGGDGSGTFNISTAVALVAAGAGMPVVKHGNRSVSSKSGSADVLAALGVPIELGPDQALRCLQVTGFAFCFAPLYHPALKNVATVRKRLGVPTLFNCLGPLVNPAGARRQLLGVGRLDLLDLMAQALAELGVDHALVVHSEDGMDEISLSGPTQVREILGKQVRPLVWRPEDFGLQAVVRSELLVADATSSAALIEMALRTCDNAAGQVILANAAAALLAADRVTNLKDGVAAARQAIASGQALGVLRKLREF